MIIVHHALQHFVSIVAHGLQNIDIALSVVLLFAVLPLKAL